MHIPSTPSIVMFWEVCTRRRNIFKTPSSRSVRVLRCSVLLRFARPFLLPSHVTACSSKKHGSRKKKVKTGPGRPNTDPFHVVLQRQRRICSPILVFIYIHFRSNEVVTLNDEVCIECFKGGVRDLVGLPPSHPIPSHPIPSHPATVFVCQRIPPCLPNDT